MLGFSGQVFARSSAARKGAMLSGGALVLALALTWLSGLPGVFAPGAWAQGGGDRWVKLATREVQGKTGRATIDLSNTKGAFHGIRVRARSGAMSLTQVELTYHGGHVQKQRRALVLRQGEPARVIDSGSEDRFLETLVLSFRAVTGEPERATLVIEGLQNPDGAVAERTQPAPVGKSHARKKKAARSEPVDPQEQERIAKEQSRPEPPRREAPKTEAPKSEAPRPDTSRPDASASRPDDKREEGRSLRSSPPSPPPPPAAPAPVTSAPPPRTGGGPAAQVDPWDVVPVFYGTDRTRVTPETRVAYGNERARRLELGRAMVTVPKAHEVPNIERPWVYRLPFTQIVLYSETEDPKRHFTIKEMRSLTKEEFLKLVRERLGPSSSYKGHALVFVHGFNTSFEHALFRTAQIAYDMKFDGAPFLYSWPSKGALSSQDYSYDRESSGAAEPYLRQFLEMVARETGATSVSIIAHSMGNQLLLPVLRDLKYAAPSGIEISQVILAAPDVDRDAFENIAREVSGVSRGVTMLAAGNDRALDISRRFWGGVPRAGDVPDGGPIVIDGVDTIDITAVSTALFGLNHSGYAETGALLGDMQQLVRTGVRPPDKRVPALERVKTAKGEYWRYPKQSH